MTPPSASLATSTFAGVRRSAATSILCVVGLTALCNIGAMAMPLFNMQVFNLALPTRDGYTLAALACGLVICLAVLGLFESLRDIAMDLIASRVTVQLSVPAIQAASCGPRPDLAVAESLADLETVRNFIAGKTCLVPFDVAWTPLFLLVLLALHWSMAVLAVVAIAVMVGLSVLGDVLSRAALKQANQASTVAMRQIADSMSAAEAVIALGMLPRLTEQWDRTQLDASAHVHRAILRGRAISAISTAVRAGITAATVGLGLYLALNSYASSGVMVGGNMILARLLLPFGRFMAFRRQWVDASSSWARLRSALEVRVPQRYADAMPAPQARLVVDGVSYLAPGGDRALLRNVSFVVEPGEAVAIIGPSSAGKSTLLRLVAGIFPATAGGIYLDGISTFMWEREDFAKHVGLMPQRPTLVEGNVADNIARLQHPDPAHTLHAAKAAGVHDVIAGLPQGYATPVSDRTLSAGQRQRIALARAMFGSPRLLLLDEPSAFLDEAGESHVERLIAGLKREGVTVLVVTHRPRLLAAVDKVLVLQDGVVAKFGPVADVENLVRKRPVRLVRAAEREPA